MKTESAIIIDDKKNQAVLLDVGGRVFKTTEHTLLADPDSYFNRMYLHQANDQNER
jgi:hypothetical protein